MKKYNLALILTGGTMVGSLLLGGRNYVARAENSLSAEIVNYDPKNTPIPKVRSSLPQYFGIITKVDPNGFKVDRASVHPQEFTVLTTDATVYMKNNSLDSLEDIAPGQTVVVMGEIDPDKKMIKASAVKVITKKNA